MRSPVALRALFILTMFLAMPAFASAQTNPSCMTPSPPGNCQYGTFCDPPKNTIKGVIGKPCTEGKVSGHCTSVGKCFGEQYKNESGGTSSTNDLSKLMQMLQQMMQALGQGGGGGGGGSPPGGSGGSPPGSQPPGGSGCTQYYEVSNPTTDPCAYYVPKTSGSINIDTGFSTGSDTSGIEDIGGTEDQTPISSLIDITGGLGGDTGTSTASGGAEDTGTTTTMTVSSSTLPRPALNADIRTTESGATVIVTSGSSTANTTIAGFYGTDAVGAPQAQGLVATWCRTRPWAQNFLSFLVPTAFFDNLCTLRGYQVGMPVATRQESVTVPTSLPKLNAPTSTASNPSSGSKPVIVAPSGPPPEARVWATPAAVPLGARTTVFWTSKNVSTCKITSPEGNFEQSSLSGGAATVPLSGATTFTISCESKDGQHVTDYFTVQLSI